jgi:FKBP-type peptidyl-prolyl cis-trans isomerase
MKKIILPVLLLISTSSLYAQPGVKPGTKQTPKPAIKPVFKNLADSASYALGRNIGSSLKSQGFDLSKLNRTLLNAAITDLINDKNPQIDDASGNMVLTKYFNLLKEEKAKETQQASESFLRQNKLRPGVITTASGLQYEVITQGTGPMMTAVDTFVCHYRGTLVNGEEFDASYNRGKPLIMAVTDVIRGWTEGLLLMPVGSKYKFYIPSQLGYGMMGQGKIPPAAALLFEVELLDIKRRL